MAAMKLKLAPKDVYGSVFNRLYLLNLFADRERKASCLYDARKIADTRLLSIVDSLNDQQIANLITIIEETF
jgi:hypothetical protein